MNNDGNNFTILSSPFRRYKLIRRRVIWLIGQWISVKFKSDLRPLLYEIILSLMQDPDLVVRQPRTESLSLSCKLFKFVAMPATLEYIDFLISKMACQWTRTVSYTNIAWNPCYHAATFFFFFLKQTINPCVILFVEVSVIMQWSSSIQITFYHHWLSFLMSHAFDWCVLFSKELKEFSIALFAMHFNIIPH